MNGGGGRKCLARGVFVLLMERQEEAIDPRREIKFKRERGVFQGNNEKEGNSPPTVLV